MRYNEILIEMKVINADGIRVWKDPTFDTLIKFTKQEPMRGIVNSAGFYMWHANAGVHEDVEHSLGLDDVGGLYITKEGQQPEASEWNDQPFIEGHGIRVYYQDYLDISEMPKFKYYYDKIKN